MAIISGGRVNVEPGEPAFNVQSVHCPNFEIGFPNGDDVWLRGDVIDGDFIFNGRLFLHNGGGGTLIDSFPKGPAPDGWEKRPSMHGEGYDLVDDRGEILFGYRVDEERICHVTVNLYRADGSLAATGGQGSLVTNGVPVAIGMPGGISIGVQNT